MRTGYGRMDGAARAVAMGVTGAAFVLVSGLSLSGCSSSTAGETSNSLSVPDKGNLLGDTGQASELASATPNAGGVNAYLWRAALDVLSFAPFASTDAVGGVIVTDWFTPPTTPNERFKMTAYVLGPTLGANAVRVAVFRQVEQGGQWVDASVAPSTSADITNKVLIRARELRSGTAG